MLLLRREYGSVDWTRLPFGRRLENVVSGLRQCRLCLRITWAIFLAILLTEAAILIFSVRAFERDRLLEVEREALVVMRVMLRGMVRQGAAPGALQQIGPKLRENTVLIGARLHDKKGKSPASSAPCRARSNLILWARALSKKGAWITARRWMSCGRPKRFTRPMR